MYTVVEAASLPWRRAGCVSSSAKKIGGIDNNGVFVHRALPRSRQSSSLTNWLWSKSPVEMSHHKR